MKISVQASCALGAKSQWGGYVENGTMKKPRDKSKIELIEGNTKLGDAISESGKWKDNEYTLVLAFKGKPDKGLMKKAYNIFRDDFMIGFDRKEYHIDAISHYDTAYYHTHIRIPKLNLLTGTALRLYMDSQDRNRVNLIRDKICKELGLDISVDEKPLIEESNELARIEKWRTDESREPFRYETKKDRTDTQLIVTSAVAEYHQAGLINSIEEVKDFIENEIGLTVTKDDGHDYAKDEYYFTVKDEQSDKKIALRGDLYSHEFWKHTREIRQEQVRNNKSNKREYGRDRRSLAELTEELEKVNRKRKKEVDNTYRRARERARSRSQKDFDVPQYNHDNSRDTAPFSVSYGDTINVSETFDKSSAAETSFSTSKALEDSRERGKEVLQSTSKRVRDTGQMDIHQNRRELNDTTRPEDQRVRSGERELEEREPITATGILEKIKEARERLNAIIGKIDEWLEERKVTREASENRVAEVIDKYGAETRGQDYKCCIEGTRRIKCNANSRDRGTFRTSFKELFGRVRECIANEKTVADAISRNKVKRNKQNEVVQYRCN